MKAKSTKLIPKFTSLADLRQRAAKDARYASLAVIAACNLGAVTLQSSMTDLALSYLRISAMESSEAGVVEEVNFCRDLVPSQAA